MKVTLHLEGKRQEVLNQIDEFRLVVSSSLEAQPPKGAKPKAAEAEAPLVSEADKLKGKKAAKGKKPEPEEEAEGDTTQEEGGEDSSEESADDMGFDEEEEVDAPAETTQNDVVQACRNFTKGDDAKKAKVKKLLGAFKVKSVLDLKKAQYSEFLAKLKKL